MGFVLGAAPEWPKPLFKRRREELRNTIGLIGTITYDEITFDSGERLEGIGGVFYQAAVLCGLGREVCLFSNLGQELVQDVEQITGGWTSLHREYVRIVPGPGNRVHLHYPEKGERVEVLKSVVPPLSIGPILENLSELTMLILVINSGFDLELREWREIVQRASCPLWIDIHSLPLARKLNIRREYLPLIEWREWVEGVEYLQANMKEVASMFGHPEKRPSGPDISRFAESAFPLGVKAVFVTQGKEAVLVLTPEEKRKIYPQKIEEVVDTTGCGDAFCGATASRLIDGDDPFKAASFGLKLATKAASVRGIEETYNLALTISGVRPLY